MTEDEWYEEYKYLEALIDQQKALLARAADALEKINVMSFSRGLTAKERAQVDELIAELREAAAE